MRWNTWVRRAHRWLSVIFTVSFIINLAAWSLGEPPLWVSLLPALPFLLLFLSGLYLFVLPYAARRREGGSTARSAMVR